MLDAAVVGVRSSRLPGRRRRLRDRVRQSGRWPRRRTTGFDDEVHDDAIGLRDDAGFAEAVEGAQVREDVFAEVAQIIGKRTAVVRATRSERPCQASPVVIGG